MSQPGTTPVTRRATAPSRLAYLTDPGRAVVELGSLLALAAPLLAALPRGDGHPVLVLPGLTQTDAATRPLRTVLRALGYQVYGWGLGRNIGPTAEAVHGLPARLGHLHSAHERPISLIGWSLGGIYARQLARRSPTAIRQVITLGSPFRLADPAENRAHRAFQRYSHFHLERWELPLEQGADPLPVPTTSIYSTLDGVVSWHACLNLPSTRAENVHVFASHFGIGHHPAALWVIADRLTQPAGHWTSFRPPPVLRALYEPPWV